MRPLCRAFFIATALIGWAGFPGMLSAKEELTRTQKSLERRQRVEWMKFLLGSPEKAELPGTSLAVSLYNQGVEYFRKNEWVLARQSLTESLVHDDRNPLTYELLGDISNLEDELDEARRFYHQAYALEPSPSLKEKIEKLQREEAVNGTLATAGDEFFIVKYATLPLSEDAFPYGELLRKTYEQLSREFAYSLRQKLVVLIYEEEDFRKITEQPHWVSGLYDGKVRMPVRIRGLRSHDLEPLAAHEMTHAFVAAMSAGRAPAWIHEGLAQYEETKIRPPDMIVYESAVATGTLLPWDQVLSQAGAVSREDPLLVSLFYQESLAIVQYLVGRYGMFPVRQLLEEYAKGRDSDEAFRNVFKAPIEQLEKEWQATIQEPSR